MRNTRSATTNAPSFIPKKRCAIYTRKSTEEGLDQEYNSLEAQRDAGLAYVSSQRQEGWLALDDTYDDGGFSGGNIDRPGLKRLMQDIEAKRIDIVVVYKIDRLTRSLPDFAKLVEVFDRNNVSFVSVTQQFNTTTSMGRLTLNILLSFAQFEREVTGERIRDKIAASKAKGMWMGGTPPLGYDVVDRKLIVNEREANLVRDIFSRYAEHGSAARLVCELDLEGHTTKSWITQSGQHRAGRTIDQQYLFYMLRNRFYLGEISHKGEFFPAQHEAIVSFELWDRVHAIVNRRKQGARESKEQYPALLSGLLFASDGQRMIHHYTKKKNGRMYRYYVPYLDKRRAAGATLGVEGKNLGALPAGEIEAAVINEIELALMEPQPLIGVWRSCLRHRAGADLQEEQVIVSMRRIAEVWKQLFPAEQQRIAQLLIERVNFRDGSLDIHWREDGWIGLDPDIVTHPYVEEATDYAKELAA